MQCNILFLSLIDFTLTKTDFLFFCVVLFCELYPGEGLQMRRLDGLGLFSFSPQPAATELVAAVTDYEEVIYTWISHFY